MKLFYTLLLTCYCGVLFAQSEKFNINWESNKSSSQDVLLESLSLSQTNS